MSKCKADKCPVWADKKKAFTAQTETYLDLCLRMWEFVDECQKYCIYGGTEKCQNQKSTDMKN